MPLAFGSILGGMTTLIGTPSNLIVSSFRASTGSGSFGMFDFAPVGVVVALSGVAFVVLFSRWLVPVRQRAGTEGFETGAYLTEARVDEGSKAAGMSLREIDKLLQDADAQVIGLIRNEVRIPAPRLFRQVRQGDILVIEAEPDGLAGALSALGLKLEEEVEAAGPSEGAATEETDRSDAQPSRTATAAKRKQTTKVRARVPRSNPRRSS
jgi:di/tricarboxylate transporter